VIRVLREHVEAASPNVLAGRVLLLEDAVTAALGPAKLRVLLLSTYGCIGVVLALVSVYGLISYISMSRKCEMGVRMAVGAQPLDVFFLIPRQGMGASIVGVLIGVAGAVAAVRLLKGLLFGVAPLDPGSFALVAFVLLSGSALACSIPALRIARAEPRWAMFGAGRSVGRG